MIGQFFISLTICTGQTLNRKDLFLFQFCRYKPNVFLAHTINYQSSFPPEHKECRLQTLLTRECGRALSGLIQLFWERLSFEVHATTPKGIVGGFEFTVFQRIWKNGRRGRGHMSASAKGKQQNSSVRDSVLNISHITFRDCRVQIFSDNLSRNSCMNYYLNIK